MAVSFPGAARSMVLALGLVVCVTGAVHAGPHKLIWAEDGRHELYDLAADPGERENLIDRPDPIVLVGR